MEHKVTVYETEKYIVRIHEPIRTEEERRVRRAKFVEDCRAYCRAVERQAPGYFGRKEARAG